MLASQVSGNAHRPRTATVRFGVDHAENTGHCVLQCYRKHSCEDFLPCLFCVIFYKYTSDAEHLIFTLCPVNGAAEPVIEWLGYFWDVLFLGS